MGRITLDILGWISIAVIGAFLGIGLLWLLVSASQYINTNVEVWRLSLVAIWVTIPNIYKVLTCVVAGIVMVILSLRIFINGLPREFDDPSSWMR